MCITLECQCSHPLMFVCFGVKPPLIWKKVELGAFSSVHQQLNSTTKLSGIRFSNVVFSAFSLVQFSTLLCLFIFCLIALLLAALLLLLMQIQVKIWKETMDPQQNHTTCQLACTEFWERRN